MHTLNKIRTLGTKVLGIYLSTQKLQTSITKNFQIVVKDLIVDFELLVDFFPI